MWIFFHEGFTVMKKPLVCDMCDTDDHETLYDGWFRHKAAFNAYARGTATAGLLQRLQVCKSCAELAISNGRACATQLPTDE